jgi:ATP-dependent Lon protease
METRRRSARRPRPGAATLPHNLATFTGQYHGQEVAGRGILLHELPVLPVRNTVILPNMVVPLFVDRESGLRAVEEALARDRALLVVTQRSADVDDPTPHDLFPVGTECSIGRVLRMPDGSNSVLVQGQRRARIETWVQQSPFGCARVACYDEPATGGNSITALRRAVLDLLERCTRLSTRLTEDTYVQALNVEASGPLADFVVAQIEPALGVRQALLETFDPAERLRRACQLLTDELHVLELEHKIQEEVQQEVDRGQREFLLREQLKAIQRELGEHDPAMRESLELRGRIQLRQMPTEVEVRALKELDRLEAMPSIAPEYHVVRTYLDWLIALPWQERTEDNLDLRRAAEVLEANHYGLARVKDRIIEYMAVRRLAPEGRTPILCLAGPPGVGKTSLGRSIAEALERKFVRVSLGGVRDEAEVRGHRRTYVGALPGRILQSIKTVGTINPVFVLDEIDKLAADFRGDPAAALLEVLDPEQNYGFSDHYLEVPYDLSQVLFVLTANVVSDIPAALRDRMEVIEVPGYTEDEKLHIARQFLVPRQMRDCGLTPTRIEIEDGAIRRVVREYTYESGVRNLERELGGITRKVARRVAEGRRHKALVTEPRVPAYLGPQKYFPTEAEQRDNVGVATGLAWTAAGGDLTTVEVMALPGRGSLTLTGQLGDVMKESAQAALTYARARAGALGLPEGFHERQDLHVHLPGGAIPKDGPSAGITMAVAIVSALTGRPVRRDVAMTGEITLRGRVLPVGGIKEKVLAAHRAGLSTVVLPRRNLRDLDEVPAEALDVLRVVPVETMDEVVAATLQARHPLSVDEALALPSLGGRIPHPPLSIAEPLPAASRVARPRARRAVAVAP